MISSPIYAVDVFSTHDRDAIICCSNCQSFRIKSYEDIYTRYLAEGSVDIIKKVFQGETIESVKTKKPFSDYIYDWTELRKWGIDEKNLPPGSIIQNKGYTFWGQYKVQILIGIILIILEAFMVVFLLLNTRKRRGAEEALRANRDYLEKLTNSMWDMVFSLKMPERVIEWVNDSIRLIGYEPSECVGKDTAFLYPDKDDFLDFGNQLKNATAAGKEVLHSESIFKRKNGETFPTEITVTFHKKNNEVVRVTSIVRDISERKENEAELEKYRKHLEALVEEQTKELEEKVMELEQMNELFVGREFRIKELRDRVKALESKVDN